MSLERNVVGSWGTSLSDDDYACALAALGALELRGTQQHEATSDPDAVAAALRAEFVAGDRTVLWRAAKRVDPSTTPSSWIATVHVDAAALAAGWERYRRKSHHARTLPRVAVRLDWRGRPDLFDFQALCDWLAHPSVRLGALMFEAAGPESRHRAGWHWPLRVGVLAGPDRPALLAAVDLARSQHPWIGDLCQVFTVGGAREACDLLLVTSLEESALRSESRARFRASVVACLDDPPQDLAAAIERHGALESSSRAAGLAWVGKLETPQRIADWFEAVIREVSHDAPIATSLWLAGQRRANRTPWIVGRAHALDTCRILAIAERQDRVVVALAEPIFGGPDVGLEAAPHAPPTPGGLAGNLAGELRHRAFDSESGDGVRSVQVLKERASAIDGVRPPRWIQANGWRPDAPEVAARSFAEQQWNLLGVHIGPSETPRSDAPFPASGIDFSQGDTPVTVQVELAGAAVRSLQASDLWASLGRGGSDLKPIQMRGPERPAGQILRWLTTRAGSPPPDDISPLVGLASSTISLPAAGDSTVALFAVAPAKDARSIGGRIAVIHANRVLQTARLSIDTSAAADVGRGLEVVTDGVVHARDDDLDERREYDVAIRVSDLGGRLHLAVQRGDAPTSVELSSLKAPIAAIRAGLKAIAEQWDYSRPMVEQPVFDTSMFTLAANGKALERHLRNFLGDEIDRWERIHLLPFTNEFLPLEYVYAGPPPRVGARACPNMTGALRAGSCDRAMSTPDTNPGACPNQSSTAFVCAMKFWGFSRLIERSGAVRPGAAAARAPRPSARVPSKHPYGSVSSLLFAASDRAFNYAADAHARAAERAGLVGSLGALCSPIPPIDDWDAWRVEATKNRPNLLVLVVHTDRVANVAVLEIGDGKFLGSHEIGSDVTGDPKRPLLLMLLGCSAAGVDDDFQPYPELFRDAGADIVLAPIALIRGVDAVRIAKRLSALLAQRLASPEPTAFGELLPTLRRELLGESYPGVLGLVGFGDGDWLLGGPVAAP